MNEQQKLLRQASFLLSSPDLKHLPDDTGCEVAFAGRSNAGKSSALNLITGQKGLARTSKTPGRTQQLVFFTLADSARRLVDLPGYGYAKVPAAVKAQWGRLLEEYLNTRNSLKGIILLMDIRHPLKEFDCQMLGWANYAGMPVHVLLTKADKLKRGAANNTLLNVQRQMKEFESASVQLFSATKQTGLEQARTLIINWLV